MKRHYGQLLFLTFLSVVAGYLLSKVSLVGRMGMSLFYKEYQFLRSWWKDSVLLFVVFMVLFALHNFAAKRLPGRSAGKVFIISAVLAVAGLYISYDDFRHTISHHLLGERFHIGVYLFWIGWIATSLYFIVVNTMDNRLPSGYSGHKHIPDRAA